MRLGGHKERVRQKHTSLAVEEYRYWKAIQARRFERIRKGFPVNYPPQKAATRHSLRHQETKRASTPSS
jgi:hypothetical protein